MKITFEIDVDATMFGGCSTGIDSLHEALCKIIHERDMDALDWLEANVTDVIHPEIVE